MRVELHAGRRADVRPLFELAEGSAAQLDAYLDLGRVLVAVDDEQVVGHVQLIEAGPGGDVEIKSMAVVASHRRRGVGRGLIAAARRLARAESRATLRVATAAASVGNLRFYQRCGFRMRSIERDAFTLATGYEPGTRIDGIELRDRVWLDLQLADG